MLGYCRGDIKQPRSQWGWSFLAFCEDVASGYIRGRSQTARRDCAVLAAGAGIGPGNARIGPQLLWLSVRLSCLGSRASGGLGKPLGGRGAREAWEALEMRPFSV